ncbi:DUF4437 domain-containing protein [Fuerstiella marisgermanici]|uniref:DUF4437 domain-containing protein n=1 Tax=Fuerstiella marisgermanici TaxID=1891926 RepID=A0A1P8WCW2_9PLAN|nr:DUF4437 domain-containing protein [Fuerstiella marisgermanici]APZ91915.1 hypothetical protein Fuma_01511 [Fuerstiella marisgermanici]
MKNVLILVVASAAVFVLGNTACAQTVVKQDHTVLLSSDLKWTPLNPARGADGPQAANLWGDRTGRGPSGFLVKFVDGFSSPPHIHNITYRGVVLQGRVFNGHQDNKPMWMQSLSYWTQPVGQVHITAAQGRSIVYVEIEDGPYLVRPTEEAVDHGEKPVNIDAGNLVWLGSQNIRWINDPQADGSSAGVEVALLWGEPQTPQPSGVLVRLPKQFRGKIRSDASAFRAVIIQGQARYQFSTDKPKSLQPGACFTSSGAATHKLTQDGDEPCVLYLQTQGTFEIHAE